MFEEILFLVIALVVAALMIADVARTRNEGLHGHVEGHAFDARRPVPAASLGSRESFSRAHAGTSMPVAVPRKPRIGMVRFGFVAVVISIIVRE